MLQGKQFLRLCGHACEILCLQLKRRLVLLLTVSVTFSEIVHGHLKQQIREQNLIYLFNDLIEFRDPCLGRPNLQCFVVFVAVEYNLCFFQLNLYSLLYGMIYLYIYQPRLGRFFLSELLAILSCLNYPLAVNEVPFSSEMFLRCYLTIFCTCLSIVQFLYFIL